MLLDYYGPELYSKLTSEFDPAGVAELSKSLGIHYTNMIIIVIDLIVKT